MAEIDVEALRENARRFKKRLGNAELIAVVKANAYGHGAVDTAAALGGCVDRFAVASPDEAAQLRAGGIRKPILLLYPLFKEELEAALLAKAEISAAGADELERADKTAQRLKTTAFIHIALNTGMNRYGADPGALPSLARQVERSSSLRLAGVSTHFTEASIPDSAFTRQQLDVFFKRGSRGVSAVRYASSCRQHRRRAQLSGGGSWGGADRDRPLRRVSASNYASFDRTEAGAFMEDQNRGGCAPKAGRFGRVSPLF